MAGIANFVWRDETGEPTLTSRADDPAPVPLPRNACASYLFGCTTHGRLAVVEPHTALVEGYASMRRLLELPDDVIVYPGHYSGSVCGRALSGNPVSTIGFERRHNAALRHGDAGRFAAALLENVPPPPADQAAIVAASRSGRLPAPA